MKPGSVVAIFLVVFDKAASGYTSFEGLSPDAKIMETHMDTAALTRGSARANPRRPDPQPALQFGHAAVTFRVTLSTRHASVSR